MERRVTDEDTSEVHYEFGRYCPENYIIKVTIENMLIHGPNSVASNNGERVDFRLRTILSWIKSVEFSIESADRLNQTVQKKMFR